MASSRRNMLLGIGSVAAAFFALDRGLPYLASLRPVDFDFSEIDGLPGFRSIKQGDVTGGFNPLVGLEAPAATPRRPNLQGTVCDALYYGSFPEPGVLPIVSFSDYNCPFCRLLTPKLAELESSSQGTIRVYWHELPLLGSGSLEAARAALAAKRQGAYVAFHERLMRTSFRPTEGYLRELTEDLGLSTDQFFDDFNDRSIDHEISQSIAVARRFGFYGTPAMVVGRTGVLGAIDDRTLTRLIELERSEPAIVCN